MVSRPRPVTGRPRLRSRLTELAKTPAELAKVLAKLPLVATTASAASVRKGAQIIKIDTLASAAAVTGGTLALRGVKSRSGKGGRLGVVYTITGAGASTVAAVKAVGPWVLIERDTKRHEVGTKTKNGRPAVLLLPDGGFATGPFMAGGSKGKHPWALGTARAQPKVTKLYQQEVTREILKNF